jgi:hypothetical protein
MNSNVKGMHRLPTDSCPDFWQLASDYHQAANLVFEKRKFMPNFPGYSLIGHALELYLKAYLRSQGEDIKALKSIGHSLEKALETAERRGLATHFKIKPRDRQRLELLSRAYQAKDFDYKAQGRWELPLPSWTTEFADRLSHCIESIANRPS